MRVKVQARIGHYPAARRSYEDLVDEVGEDSPLVSDLAPLVRQVTDAINSGSILQINGKVREKGGLWGCDNSYQFTPVHRNTAFSEIDGTLDAVEMRCDHRHYESEIPEMVEWQIPEAWGRCSIRVRGKPGTTFSILMMPDT